MERQNAIEKLKGLWSGKNGRRALVGISVATFAIWIGFYVSMRHPAHRAPASEEGAATQRGFFSRVFARYEAAIDSTGAKLREIRSEDEENHKLRLENANLRLRVESLQFDCRAREAAQETRNIELRLSEETWAMAGRSMETILYQVPTHLLPQQLYTLAVSYFKNAEYEKSAKIMTLLTGMDDSDAFKSPKNYLMTGVLWYRLDNYLLADKYFDKVLQFSDAVENVPFKAQARLWRALVSERTDHHEKAQSWLLQLVDHHPLSTEASWVNAKEVTGARSLATEKTEH
jgi:tetratricopeptide (TPR) repeat protein